MASEKYIAYGGYSDLKENEKAQCIANAVKTDLEEKAGLKFKMYTAILYKTKIVQDETYYLIAVQTCEKQSCHIVVRVHPDGKKCLGMFMIDMDLYAPLSPIYTPPHIITP